MLIDNETPLGEEMENEDLHKSDLNLEREKNINEDDEEPGYEPECSSSEKEREELDIECEFEVKDGSWWCSTHNCWA